MKLRFRNTALLLAAMLLLAGVQAKGQKQPGDPRIHPSGPDISPAPVRPSTGPTQTVVTNPVGRPVGGIPIRNLAVHIVTSTLSNAGTNSDVYFDIGPYSWHLDKDDYNDFESGDDDYYNLLPNNDQYSALDELTTNDILWMRLQLRGNDTWKPQTIELLVNGSVFARADVRGLALDADHWYWASSVPGAPAYSREEQFLHALKLLRGGYSGLIEPSQPEWTQGLPPICVIGHPFDGFIYGQSSGFMAESLEIESVEIGSHQYTLDRVHGFNRSRYLTIAWRPQDFPSPTTHQVMRICGELLWNKSSYGDYLLIPRNRTDTTFTR